MAMELLATEEEEVETIAESEEEEQQQLVAMELLDTEGETMGTVEGEIETEDGEVLGNTDFGSAKPSTLRLLRALAEEVRETKEVIANMKSRLKDSDFDASASIENMKTRLRDIGYDTEASDDAEASDDEPATPQSEDLTDDADEDCQSSSYSKTVKIQLSDLIVEEDASAESDGGDVYQQMLMSSLGEGRENHAKVSCSGDFT